MTNEEIKKIALENGFKLKEQDDGSLDLNSYVYKFAHALLSNDKWVSVDERLPSDSDTYCIVALYDKNDGDFAEFALDCWYDFDSKTWLGLSDLQKDFCIVKFWQPLPKTPKIDGD